MRYVCYSSVNFSMDGVNEMWSEREKYKAQSAQSNNFHEHTHTHTFADVTGGGGGWKKTLKLDKQTGLSGKCAFDIDGGVHTSRTSIKLNDAINAHSKWNEPMNTTLSVNRTHIK